MDALRAAVSFPRQLIVAMWYVALYCLKIASGLALIAGCGSVAGIVGGVLVFACTLGKLPELSATIGMMCGFIGAWGAVTVLDGPARSVTVIRGRGMKGSVKEDV